MKISLFAQSSLCALALALCAPARADVLPKGHREVEWSVVYQNLDAFPEYEFWIGPNSKREFKRAMQDWATSYYLGYSATLVAVPRGTEPSTDGDLLWARGVPVLSSVLESSPVTHSRTLVTVTGISDVEILYEAEMLTAELPAPDPVGDSGGARSIVPDLDNEAWERVRQGLPPFPETGAGGFSWHFTRKQSAIAAFGVLAMSVVAVLGLLAIRRRRA